MRYREIPPQAPLGRVVECFWTLDGEAEGEASKPERILPDGCVELILNFGAEFEQHCDDGPRLQPRNFLVGQMTGPIVISPTGRVELLGIRFHPGGTLPFLRVPLHEITDQVVEVGSLSSKLERDLMRVTAESSSLTEKIRAIERLLTHYLADSKHDSWLMTLAGRIVHSRGLVSVDELASDAGVSSRQLERRFLREVGVGPKLLGRIIRFQQVFRAVEHCNAAWAEIAIECGYYDQAHLIRDFNQFARRTPAVLFSSQSALTEAFTRKMRRSDFYNTSGVGFV
jgi:AraC-like DNA-binding protein